MLELMTAWIVILWRFAATYAPAKHNRAEMLNSNTPPAAKAYLLANTNTPLQRIPEVAETSPLSGYCSLRESTNPLSDCSLLKTFHRSVVRSWVGERVLERMWRNMAIPHDAEQPTLRAFVMACCRVC